MYFCVCVSVCVSVCAFAWFLYVCADIGELLNHEHLEQKKTNRAMFLQILENIRFLARQGLPLRNVVDDDSNFGALLSIVKTVS